MVTVPDEFCHNYNYLIINPRCQVSGEWLKISAFRSAPQTPLFFGPLYPGRRSLSQSGWLLSQKSIKMRKYTTTGVQNTKKLENRCNIDGEWCKLKSAIFNINYMLSQVIGYWLLVFNPKCISFQSAAIPDRRTLSHNSRPLSQKSITIRKYTIRAVQNTKKHENRPNSDGER